MHRFIVPFVLLIPACCLGAEPPRSRAPSPAEPFLQTGHSEPISAIAFSDDGKNIATGGEDGRAAISDPHTGEELWSNSTYRLVVSAIGFSSDGKSLYAAILGGGMAHWDISSTAGASATIGDDGAKCWAFSPSANVALWEAQSREAFISNLPSARKRTMLDCKSRYHAYASFSRDGTLLATADVLGSVVFWDTATGRRRRSLEAGRAGIYPMALAPDGKLLATASFKGDVTVTIWDVASAKQIRSLAETHKKFIYSLAFSPGGKRLAVAGYDSRISVWDTASGQRIRELESGAEGVRCAVFSPDGKRLAAGSVGSSAAIWDTDNWRIAVRLAGHLPAVDSIAVSPANGQLAIGRADGDAAIWDSTGQKPPVALAGRHHPVYGITFSPDGQQVAAQSVASGNEKMTVTAANAATGQTQFTLAVDSALAGSAAYDESGKELMTCSSRGELVFWDSRTGKQLRQLKLDQPNQSIGGIGFRGAFGPLGKLIATSGTAGGVVLWELPSGERLLTIPMDGARISTRILSPSGALLATSSTRGELAFWNTRTGEKLRAITQDLPAAMRPEHRAVPRAFSPNSKTLLTSTLAGSVVLWNTENGKPIRALVGHAAGVRAAAFSDDGRWIFTGSLDGSVIVWKADTGERLVTLYNFDAGKEWLVLVPNGDFDGSEGGRRLVRFRDPADPLKLLPAGQGTQSHYHPHLLADVLASGAAAPSAPAPPAKHAN